MIIPLIFFGHFRIEKRIKKPKRNKEIWKILNRIKPESSFFCQKFSQNSERSNKISKQKGTMASVYKVTEIEGKGLGCVAILDIEKGYIFLLNDYSLFTNWHRASSFCNYSKWQGKFLQNHMFKDVLIT